MLRLIRPAAGSSRRHHLHLVDQGIEWTLPRAKNDQDGRTHIWGTTNPANRLSRLED